jgi:hypothetical protein
LTIYGGERSFRERPGAALKVRHIWVCMVQICYSDCMGVNSVNDTCHLMRDMTYLSNDWSRDRAASMCRTESLSPAAVGGTIECQALI